MTVEEALDIAGKMHDKLPLADLQNARDCLLSVLENPAISSKDSYQL